MPLLCACLIKYWSTILLSVLSTLLINFLTEVLKAYWVIRFSSSSLLLAIRSSESLDNTSSLILSTIALWRPLSKARTAVVCTRWRKMNFYRSISWLMVLLALIHKLFVFLQTNFVVSKNSTAKDAVDNALKVCDGFYKFHIACQLT